MPDRSQLNRRHNERPYDRRGEGDQKHSTRDSDKTGRKDINRIYSDKQKDLNEERMWIKTEQNLDGKSRYEEYSLIAENLGRLVAEEYRLFEQNEAVPSTGNLMRIHATRQEIFASRETNINEHNTLVSEFQGYASFANRIRRFNEDIKDHNNHCPAIMRVEEIQDHLKLMNKAFNNEIGDPDMIFFTQADWNISLMPPPTPPRRSDGYNSSDTSSSDRHNRDDGHSSSDTSSSDGYNSSDTSSNDGYNSSDIDID